MSSPHPWTVLVLLALFILIDFWDRAAFGFAATQIMRDLRLSHTEFGLLAGVFFWLFSASALATGWLTGRFSPKWIMGSLALLWAVAQALAACTFGSGLLLISRLLLGLGEGPAYPAAIHKAYSAFPRRNREMVTALISSGVPLGIASGALVITSLVETFGWRMSFAFLSLLSVAWSIVWLASHQSAAPVPAEARSEGWSRAVRANSTTVGAIIAAFCAYWVLALAVSWFPAFVQVVDEMSPIRAGEFLALAWAFQALVFPLAARFSASLRHRGYRSEVALAAPAACAVAVSGLAFVAAGYVAMNWVGLALIAVSLWSTAVAITSLPPMIAEVTPHRERGAALGVFAAFSSMAGIFAPLVFGHAVDVGGGSAHAYRVALVVSGTLLVVAAPIALALMKPTRHAITEDREEAAPLIAGFG